MAGLQRQFAEVFSPLPVNHSPHRDVARVNGAYNPKKCVRQREIQYLGYHLGGGKVRPQVSKAWFILLHLRHP